jgi:hypothetical protein
MMDKTTHFGRAGEFFAMSELLLRGWNVAVPVVDVGDDVFIIDDNDKNAYRLQVKTAQASRRDLVNGRWSASFSLSRRQLSTAQPTELFFMLVVRIDDGWRFLIIPRIDLFGIRDGFVTASRGPQKGRGRPPKRDADAKSDDLTLTIQYDTKSGAKSLIAWNAELSPYLERWPPEIHMIAGGPGARSSMSP